jgi:hypothetical protein
MNLVVLVLSLFAVASGDRPSSSFYPTEDSISFAAARSAAMSSPVERADPDFNNDGAFGNQLDVDDFLSVFSEGPCSTGNCDSIDTNRDGSLFDPRDIDAFVQRVRFGMPPDDFWSIASIIDSPLQSATGLTIYVDSVDGSDSNDGRTSLTPVRTIARGASMLRNNSPDSLLLADGGEWFEKIQTRDGAWTIGGRSPRELMTIGRYSTGRPALPKITYRGSNPEFSSEAIRIQGEEFPGFLRITGIAFQPAPIDVAHCAIYIYTPRSHIAIDSCTSIGGNSFLILDGIEPNGFTDLHVTGNYIGQTKRAAGRHAGGCYLVRCARVLFDFNTFDRVGWDGVARVPDDKFNQGVYVVGNFETATEGSILFVSNTMLDPAHAGFQLRGGLTYAVFNRIVGAPIGASGGHAMLPPGHFWYGAIANNEFEGFAAIPGAAQGECIRVSRGGNEGGPAMVLSNQFINPRSTIVRESPLGDITFWGNITQEPVP